MQRKRTAAAQQLTSTTMQHSIVTSSSAACSPCLSRAPWARRCALPGAPSAAPRRIAQVAQHDALCGASLASPALAQRCGPSVAPAASSHKHSDASSAATSAPEQQHQHGSMDARATASSGVAALSVVALLALAAEQPALAADVAAPTSNPFNELTANSLYVTLALFLMSVPGIWSQIKRAPAANKKRKTYEVDGPGRAGAMSLKDRAKQIVTYFKKYNYEVKEMGEVITFAGLYAADKGQAAAVTFYTFVGMASVALVLSLLVPDVGNWWYLLTLAAPAAWLYYFQRGERVEEVRVKMVTADDEQTTDIIIEGDIEEIERFRKELNLLEKGMVRVKGLLEV